MLNAVMRKAARLKSARLEAVMKLLPYAEPYYFHTRTHTHTQTSVYNDTRIRKCTHTRIHNHSVYEYTSIRV